MKLAKQIGIATAGIALSLAAVDVKSADAAFVGPYSISNWSLLNTNADGFVNTSGAPGAIQVYGGNNGGNSLGTTDYLTTAVVGGAVSFDWNFATADAGAIYDPFYFVKNDEITSIFSGRASTGSGTYKTTIAAGDVFGFQIATIDNQAGRGNVTISNFAAPVPEPFTIGGSAVALGFGWWMKRKQAATSQKA